MPKSFIEHKGNKFYYNSRIELGRKLFKNTKNPTLEATKLLNLYKNKKTSRILLNEDTGDFIKINLQDKPLLLQQDFGIKNISNKNFMNIDKYSKITKKTNWKVVTNLSASISLELTIEYRVLLKYSNDWELKEGSFNVDIAPNLITDDYVLQFLADFYELPNDENSIKLDNSGGPPWKILSQYTNQKVNIVNQTLRKSNPLKLCNIFNDILYENTKEDGKCIQEYLKSIHPKIWNTNKTGRQQKYNEEQLKKLNNMTTTQDIYNYAVEKKCRMCAYDISGKCFKSHYPIKKSKYKNINFVANNNHLYPIINPRLNKINRINNKLDLELVPNATTRLIELIKNDLILPTKITLNPDLTIKSYVNDNKIIINNDDYENCLMILTKFGLKDQMTPYTTLKNISNIIEKIYIKDEKIASFLPNNSQWCKGGYNYTNNNDDNNIVNDDDNLITIDKIKAYPFSLTDLSCLLSTNIASCKSGLYNGEKINKNWLYIVKPQYNYILLPNTNISTGEHILYSRKEGCEFEILEYLECYAHKNLYKEMIEDLYNHLKDTELGMKCFKTIGNVMIGKFESNRETYYTKKVDKIVNEDEMNCSKGHFVQLDNEYYVNFHYQKHHNIDNKLPISIQIKDKCRVLIYKMMKKLNLNKDDLVQVKTDSICFKNNKDINYKKYINNNLDGWKVESNTKLIKPKQVFDTPKSFIYKESYNINRIYDCKAGCGKSYHFKQEIDTMIKKYENYDYIVLTPSHATLKEYKLKNYTCKTIQSFSYFQTVPTQKYIYVDEIGMVDGSGWSVLYKCHLMGKIITCAGDFLQLLPPVDAKRYNNPNFINKMFHNQLKMGNNYRNNFTNKYYDSLINGKKTYLHQQVDKYNTKNYWESDVIICYTNKERLKYNTLMLTKLGFEKINEVGIKIICSCKKGELAKKDIYNKFTYTIQKIEGDIITIDDDGLTITLKELTEHFDLGYARTLYSVQGETIDSYYYPKNDYRYLKGCESYTLISRLKQKVDISSFKPYKQWDVCKEIIKNKLNIFLDKVLQNIIKDEVEEIKCDKSIEDYVSKSYSELNKLKQTDIDQCNNGDIDLKKYQLNQIEEFYKDVINAKMNKSGIIPTNTILNYL